MTASTLHANAGLRVAGEGFIRRTNLGSEQPVIGPLAMEYIGATAQADRTTVADTRRATRGAPIAAVIDVKEPKGKLVILGASRKVLAMMLLGSEVSVSQSGGSASGESHTYSADYGIQLDHENVSDVIVYPGAAATLDTGVVLSNNALTWTAKTPGTDGNSITIAVIDPTGNNVALSVAVTGTDIVVTCATDGSSAITSTAAQVKAAIEASAAASALVSVAHKSTSTGAAAVVAVAETHLSGGSVTGTPYTVDTDYVVQDSLEGIIRPVAGGGMGASGTCFVSYSYGAITGSGVKLGGDATVEADVKFAATNDLVSDDGTTGAAVRIHMPRALLTPTGEVNFAGKDPVKVEFDVVPLPPATGDAFTITWPNYA